MYILFACFFSSFQGKLRYILSIVIVGLLKMTNNIDRYCKCIYIYTVQYIHAYICLYTYIYKLLLPHYLLYLSGFLYPIKIGIKLKILHLACPHILEMTIKVYCLFYVIMYFVHTWVSTLIKVA